MSLCFSPRVYACVNKYSYCLMVTLLGCASPRSLGPEAVRKNLNNVLTICCLFSGLEFPWGPKPFREVIAGPLLRNNGQSLESSSLEGSHVGVYFSAHWVSVQSRRKGAGMLPPGPIVVGSWRCYCSGTSPQCSYLLWYLTHCWHVMGAYYYE